MADEKKVTGRLSIDTDDDGLMAVLHFVPDEAGSEFNLQAINRFITEKQIIYGINRKELDEKLSALMNSSEESSVTIAEGDAPENPVPEERIWAEMKIPEEHMEDVERVLRNAAPPQIYRTELESIKQEKTVKKKGLLPFGKEKEEKVSETIKKEKKIKIDVNPEIIEAGWVDAGDKLAEIKPGKPGRPGKDVFGKPIQPASIDDDFWPGRGIEKKAGAFSASEAGIFRRGLNWAEILPFKAHDWKLELSKDKNTCLLSFNPGGTESSPPDPSEIIKRAEIIGCKSDSLFDEERLTGIINTAIASGKSLENAIISTDDDGFFEIKVAEDKLKAEMVMHKARGNGKPLVLKQAGAAIKASGLKGLDLKKIQETILEFYKGSETDIAIILAEGTAAENSGAGSFEFQMEFLKEQKAEEIRKRAGLSGEDAELPESASDFPTGQASGFAIVKKDQQIAVMFAQDGKKGSDVFGKDIESDTADHDNILALENVRTDAGKYIAEIDGLFEKFEKDGKTALRVSPYRDTEIEVEVSKDRMTATLNVASRIGLGNPPSLEEANRLIEEAGIKNGIISDAVRSSIDRAREGEDVSGALIAMGKPPKNAGECKLKFLIEMAGGEAVSIDATGRANYRKQNKISSVKEGDIIAEIQVIQGDSEDGWDVCGNVLAAKQLTPLNVEIGNNIREEKDESGDTFLVAEKSGRVLYENNRMEIQENLGIKGDVDFSTGNIKFGGDVNIKGNVRSGFYVMAGGNISVGMNTEKSLLTSEKSIVVGQGVKGGGKAIVRVKDSIQLSFAERATLLAVEDITVKNAVFGCKVKCNGHLKLTGDKGYLVGGRIQARKGIAAANIGSVSGTRTEVSFGQDYLIADKIEIEEAEINKIKERLIRIDPEMRILEKNGDKNQLAKLRMEKVKLMKILEKRSMRVFSLKERFEQHFAGEIVIRGEVFPGVVFESHGRVLEITKKEKSVKIVFDQETGILDKVSLGDNKA